jgi:hypothetical protein
MDVFTAICLQEDDESADLLVGKHVVQFLLPFLLTFRQPTLPTIVYVVLCYLHQTFMCRWSSFPQTNLGSVSGAYLHLNDSSGFVQDSFQSI